MVGPTTSVIEKAPSCYSAVEQLCSCRAVASGSSPAYVGSPSSCGGLGTCEDLEWCNCRCAGFAALTLRSLCSSDSSSSIPSPGSLDVDILNLWTLCCCLICFRLCRSFLVSDQSHISCCRKDGKCSPSVLHTFSSPAAIASVVPATASRTSSVIPVEEYILHFIALSCGWMFCSSDLCGFCLSLNTLCS